MENVCIKESPDSDWPEAWMMPDTVEDGRDDNRLEPNISVGVAELREIGLR